MYPTARASEHAGPPRRSQRGLPEATRPEASRTFPHRRSRPPNVVHESWNCNRIEMQHGRGRWCTPPRCAHWCVWLRPSGPLCRARGRNEPCQVWQKNMRRATT